MFRTTQEELEVLVISETATDITNWPPFRLDALIKTRSLKMIAESHGFWGIDGALFEDKDGASYVVIGRSGVLYRLLWEVWLPDEKKPFCWKGFWRR